MKKICVLVSLLLLLLSSVASAATWVWLDSTDTFGLFYDQQTIKYLRDYNGKLDKNNVEFWVKTVYTPEEAAKDAEALGIPAVCDTAYTVGKQRLNFRDRKATFFESTFYSDKGEILLSVIDPNFRPHPM